MRIGSLATRMEPFRNTERLYRRVVVAGIMTASLLVATGIYAGLLGGPVVRAVAELTAEVTAMVLSLVGMGATVDGTVVIGQGFAADIVAECTALGPLAIFAGAVIAYPSAWRAKAGGLTLGLVVLIAVNLVRIVSLFWIGASYPRYLDVAHLVAWQAGMVLVALVLWLYWTRTASRTEPRMEQGLGHG